MSEHTPTPWRVVGPPDLRIVGPGGELIADIGEWSRPDDEEEYQASATFIVGACNAHSELVKALEGMIAAWRTGVVGYAMKDAEHALAKASRAEA